MRLFKPARPDALDNRARQFHLRADELDREGKHIRAQAERERAKKYERAAEMRRNA